MKCDWRPTKPLAFLDFETQSSHELRGSTAQKYAKDPSTRVLTCVVKIGDEYHKMGPYLTADDRAKLSAIAESHVLVAHNAPFDAAVWEHAEKLPEATWFDTLPCARAAGLPGQLDKLGVELMGQGKDKNGERLIEMLCMVRDKVPAVGPAHDLLMEYNWRDVELLEQIFHHVKDYGTPATMAVDRAINERGIPVDRGFAIQLRDLFAENRKHAAEEFEQYELEGKGVNPRSHVQMQRWMAAMGFQMDGVNKAALKAFTDDPEKFYVGGDDAMSEALAVVQEALIHRKELVGIGTSKLDAVLGGLHKNRYLPGALEADGRIRDQFVVYGAGPGRWAGRALQPHNLPSVLARSVDLRNVDMTYESVVETAKRASVAVERHVSVAEILNGMIRHIVRSPALSVADYAQVEARGLAWIAGETSMLKAFEDPRRSLYIDLGERIFGRRLSKKDEPNEYGLCKALILGCGYGMSGSKFDFTYRSRGELGIIKAMEDSGYTAYDAVKFYRETYPAIPALWRKLSQVVMDAVQGASSEHARCKFYMQGRHLHIELPSGRPIVYRNARVAPMVPAYCKMYNMPEVAVPTVVYDHPRGYLGFLHGAKTTENIVQGLCADLLAEALVRQEQMGLRPCLHVHDEAGCETDRLEEFVLSMCDPPPWAKGFPILAEGYVGPMWSKNTDGYAKLDGLNGRIL